MTPRNGLQGGGTAALASPYPTVSPTFTTPTDGIESPTAEAANAQTPSPWVYTRRQNGARTYCRFCLGTGSMTVGRSEFGTHQHRQRWRSLDTREGAQSQFCCAKLGVEKTRELTKRTTRYADACPRCRVPVCPDGMSISYIWGWCCQPFGSFVSPPRQRIGWHRSRAMSVLPEGYRLCRARNRDGGVAGYWTLNSEPISSSTWRRRSPQIGPSQSAFLLQSNYLQSPLGAGDWRRRAKDDPP